MICMEDDTHFEWTPTENILHPVSPQTVGDLIMYNCLTGLMFNFNKYILNFYLHVRSHGTQMYEVGENNIGERRETKQGADSSKKKVEWYY